MNGKQNGRQVLTSWHAVPVGSYQRTPAHPKAACGIEAYAAESTVHQCCCCPNWTDINLLPEQPRFDTIVRLVCHVNDVGELSLDWAA